jgi:hypothetical protein
MLSHLVGPVGIREISLEWATRGREGLMFRSGDMVEEVATNRRGRVAAFGTVGMPVSRWTVDFIDGKIPLVKEVTNINEWCVVESNQKEAPRLIPRNPVV